MNTLLRLRPLALLLPLAGLAFAAPTPSAEPAPARAVLELAEFRLKPGAAETEFLLASRALEAFLRGRPGYLSRQLVRHADGRFCDVVKWSDFAAATAAQQVAGTDERALAYFAFLDETSVTVAHPEIVDSSTDR
jgi:hypothetical protein